jgi:hypothetical protein
MSNNPFPADSVIPSLTSTVHHLAAANCNLSGMIIGCLVVVIVVVVVGVVFFWHVGFAVAHCLRKPTK